MSSVVASTVTISETGSGIFSQISGFDLVAEAPLGEKNTITVTGGNSPVTLIGGSMDDIIKAGAGDATIIALGGNDNVMGGSGDDTILGGDGADTIMSGAGDDLVIGGAGKDIFEFAAGQFESGSLDEIIDFEDGSIDSIIITGVGGGNVTYSADTGLVSIDGQEAIDIGTGLDVEANKQADSDTWELF